MRSQTTRTIAGQVNADGSTKTGSGGFTSRKTAVGTYKLTFPGARLISCTANCNSSGAYFANVADLTAIDCTVYMPGGAGGLYDGVFAFTATVAA